MIHLAYVENRNEAMGNVDVMRIRLGIQIRKIPSLKNRSGIYVL